MNLPTDFVSTIKNTFGADDERFIADLPVLAEDASRRRGIEDHTGWEYSMQFAEMIAAL